MSELLKKIASHLEVIYPDSTKNQELAQELMQIMGLDSCSVLPVSHENRWDETDIWLITYGDSIQDPDKTSLQYLLRFLDRQLISTVNGVHILPFFPYSSDDGFSVIDFVQVNESLGTWDDIEEISKQYHLMADLVINHCSARSRWFENFKRCKHPGVDYFVEVDETFDTSQVVRPRTSSLLKSIDTLQGDKSVWCTFSHDQIDLNYRNPRLLCEMINIIKMYMDRGVRIFRLDAVAFLWKESGTDCIHLPQTHELVRLVRTLVEHYSADSIIITETNVPNHENLSYYGNANEAHAVYNFCLPPLLVHTLVSGSSRALTSWLSTMPPSQMGTFYFNFIASHDGIGLRPAEGFLTQDELNQLIKTAEYCGAKVSWRTSNEVEKPYEMNVALYDMLAGTVDGPDQWQIARYICAHGIMLALEGVPGIYIHSFIGTQNYEHGVEHTNRNRVINRYKWLESDLLDMLNNQESHHSIVFESMKDLCQIRRGESCFHPNAEQFVLHLKEGVFGFWRQNIELTEAIFCIYNISNQPLSILISDINLPHQNQWYDLIGGQVYQSHYESLQLSPYQFVWLKGLIS